MKHGDELSARFIASLNNIFKRGASNKQYGFAMTMENNGYNKSEWQLLSQDSRFVIIIC